MPHYRKEAKPARTGRLLTALFIDDEKLASLRASDSVHRRHVEFDFIKRWTDAQFRLRSGIPTRGADILLVDVGWVYDESFELVSGAKTDPQSANAKLESIQPIGPLLALPFLGLRPIMSCVVYSGHSKNQVLLRNTAFLVAMGLIAARTEDVTKDGYESSVLRKIDGDRLARLDRVIAELAARADNSATGALEVGLADFQDDLSTRVKDRVVFVTNRTDVSRRLHEVIQKCKAGELVPADDTLYLGLAGDGWRDVAK